MMLFSGSCLLCQCIQAILHFIFYQVQCIWFLYWGLWSTWTWVLCRVIDINLFAFSYMQTSSWPATFVKDTFFPLYGFGFFVKNWVSVGVWVYFCVFDFIDQSVCFYANTMQFLLLLLCSIVRSQEWWYL